MQQHAPRELGRSAPLLRAGARAGGQQNQANKGQGYVAKKVLPVHLEDRERGILRLLSERQQVSMAEVVRRMIRSAALDVMDPKALDRSSVAPVAAGDGAH